MTLGGPVSVASVPWTGAASPRAFAWEATHEISSPLFGENRPLYTSSEVVVEEDYEVSEPRTDLKGLLDCFEQRRAAGSMITEVTYVVNYWGGDAWVLPFRHHGFIIRFSPSSTGKDFGYLTLDFGRRGIVWDIFNQYPEFPDHTIFARKYDVHVDPLSLKLYCQETKPFSWFANNCELWSRNAMKVMKIPEAEGYHVGPDEGRLRGQTRSVRLPTCTPFAICAASTK